MEEYIPDAKAKEIGIAFLSWIGAQNITDSDELSKYYAIDLICEGSGHTIITEIKGRDIAHDKFADQIIEKTKYDNAMLLMEVSGFTYGSVISIYNDGYLASANLKGAHTIQKRRASKTTCFNNNKKVIKEFCSYPQTHLFRFTNNNGVYTFEKER